ncbi:hypothetical protein [Helicobacter cappadocius]|uniref:Uncharacterized protein n=1 Tax=Helicobacter cappadocius TaxID=3063998 RepID=A0AA90PYB0_9HELI|nr:MULTISPECIES: hypothetical protein [unclassified Helicobacter]MDO7253071.1 hypothetical protein [Helicobacter sp. faydin-H75]MDP2538803.1 hypothetical protein [Helicobacter sp. faydin-H76]
MTEEQVTQEQSKDFKNNENIKKTGDKKMEKNKTANVKLTEIDDLLEENIVPNQNIIAQYNRKKEEAKKLKVKLERLMGEIKVLGNKIKGISEAV